MSFYGQTPLLHTNFLNDPFVSNNSNMLNGYYVDNFSSITYFDIDNNYTCESTTYTPFDCSDFADVESSHSDFLFKQPEIMELHINPTSVVIKSEPYENTENHSRLQMCTDNSLQSLQYQNDIYPKVDAAPSSPKSVTSYSSSHSTTSESKKRIHQCAYCSRSFVRKHDLIRHKRIHTGIKPYQCPCCLKSFSRSDARRHHFRKVAACRDGAEKLPRRRKSAPNLSIPLIENLPVLQLA